MILQEDMFEELTDTAIENLFINSINKKWDSVSDFNAVLNTLKSEQYDEFIPVIEGILADEHNHIGQLQHILETLSANTDAIEQGEQEATEILSDGVPMDESLVKESLEQDIYNWLSQSYGTERDGVDWKERFRDYINKLKISTDNKNNLTTDIVRAIKRYSDEFNIKPQKIMSVLQESLRNEKNIDRNNKLRHKEVATESLQEDVDENAPVFYVSYYEESPAYHPEEGGYYVATCELISSEEFDNLEDAKLRIEELASEDVMEKMTDEFYLDRSKYIGGDRFYIIETEQGSEEKDDEIYS